MTASGKKQQCGGSQRATEMFVSFQISTFPLTWAAAYLRLAVEVALRPRRGKENKWKSLENTNELLRLARKI